LALDILDLEMGRVDMTLQMVGLHETGATLRAEIRSVGKNERASFIVSKVLRFDISIEYTPFP